MATTTPPFFDRMSSWFANITGAPGAFALALGIVIVWAMTGPLFDFSETWQLVINTGTTIITFLLLFIVQNTQTRDTEALHLKLDALILVMSECDNELMQAESLGRKELERLIDQYRKKGQTMPPRPLMGDDAIDA